MTKKSFLFAVVLLAILCIVFCLHLGLLHYKNLPLFEHKIILSYCVNYVMAFVILFAVEKAILKKSSQSGFIFMAGSGLKFLFFFLLFYPSYKADGDMETAEFTAFFIPYAVCLTLEVVYLSKALNKQSF